MAEKSTNNNNGLPKKKRSKTASIAKAEDRLSKLPDITLGHILSFLPTTNDVVRTCILSKRWKLIWYSVPKLCFCDTSTTVPEFQKLENYVDNCLEHRKKVDNKVKEYLSVDLEPGKCENDGYYYYYCLPKTVLNLRALTILELRGIELGYSFGFPSLNSLSLENVRLSNNVTTDVLTKSFTDCPSLEKLSLRLSSGK
ncbi:F-box/LRR-repeat protein 25-like [Cannabis sativa]|uniref:F-box/LRR-repeat protein 25-like n=1 Tax=Cannabis sativa TaxID=3483 RepID=UPI0029CA5BD5|nr:F-box/LRR-repeat protein 25-like [Cannabis sativa]